MRLKPRKETNMKTKNQPLSALTLKSALAAAVLALLAAILPAPAAGGNPNPGILPLGSSGQRLSAL
jgi:hypothetical protein